jgi:DnaJ-class molecular chaperone
VATRQTHKSAGAVNEDGDFYKILGVSYTATFQEITRAYREAMKRSHPDRHRPERRAAAEERAKLLNRAFTTLSKADSRRAYDSEIKASAIQEEIMSRYFGGFAVPGEFHDPHAQSLRRKPTSAERVDQKRADRSAITSVLIVFAGITLVVIGLLVLWTLLEALFGAIV